MTAAYRFKGIGWFVGCVAVVLGFYLVSLQVAAERKKLDGVNARIAAAERDIRALETEFDTRANLAQLEKWNGDTLALAAPVAAQYVRDEAALAAIDVNQTGGPEVRTAALVVPSRPMAAPVAAGGAAAPAMAAATPAPIRVALVQTGPVHDPRAPAMARAANAVRAAAAVARVRPQAVAMLDRKLLSDATFGDLASGARSEAGRLR